MDTNGLCNGVFFTFCTSMGILLICGYFAKERVPPVPTKAVCNGRLLNDHAATMRGQDVYQRCGLMDHGSVWGYGSLCDMDFSANMLPYAGSGLAMIPNRPVNIS